MAINSYHEIEIKNGNYLPIKFTPADYTVDYQSLVGPDSGRTMDGSMIISDWYLRKTTKLTVKLPPHHKEDPLYSRIFSYVQGQVVKVSYYDYLSHQNKSQIEFYCSETSMGWSYKGLVNDASFELIEMKGDKTVTPVTSITQYTITTAVDPSASGTVTGGGTYYKDTSCVLTATPATGYHFDHWNSDNTDTNPVKAFTVTATGTYTAHFIADAVTYTISTSVAPAGSGSVSGGGSYVSGTTCTLQATPASGYIFSHWGSDSTDTSASKTFTVSGDASYTANFVTEPSEYWAIHWDDGISFEDEDEDPYDVKDDSLTFNFYSNGQAFSNLGPVDANEMFGYNGMAVWEGSGASRHWNYVNPNYQDIITYINPSTVFTGDWEKFLQHNGTVTHYS